MRTRTSRFRSLILVATLTVAACTSQSVMSLSPGDCFDDTTESLGGGDISSVPSVDCDDPHDNEVFHVVDFPGAEYSAIDIDSFGEASCYQAFAPYVGRDYETSILEFGLLIPSRESWEDGDREIVCVAYRMDLQKLRGSVRGSGL